MAYIKREGGKRFGGGNKPSFGARGGKPSFGKKSWGSKPASDAPTTFFKATCTKCGDACEVPFRPTAGKPVLCRNCFVKSEDRGPGRDGARFPRRDFNAHSDTRSTSAPRVENSNSDVLKQLELMNAKLERLIQAVEASQK